MINQIVKEVEICLDNECYIAALTSALILPDICGKAEYPNEKTSLRYKKWYYEWIGQYEKCPDDEDDMPYLSGELIYSLRCSLLHEGNPDVDLNKNNLTSFKLLITDNYMSGGSATIYHDSNGNHGREIEIGIKNLCFKLCRLAKVYYEENKDKFNFNYTLVKVPF